VSNELESIGKETDAVYCELLSRNMREVREENHERPSHDVRSVDRDLNPGTSEYEALGRDVRDYCQQFHIHKQINFSQCEELLHYTTLQYKIVCTGNTDVNSSFFMGPMIKSWRMRWARHVGRMTEMRNAYKIWSENLKGRATCKI
jgi:hypothetical protein